MTDDDLVYVARLLDAGILRGPVLELGAGYGGPTCRELVTGRGLAYSGTDLKAGPGVDFVADFERDGELGGLRAAGSFGAVLVLNVLEHTFDPIRVVDNARTLLAPGGALVLLTPAIWPLHDYPMDCWRVLPSFYEEYARRRKLTLLREWFEYVGLGPVARYRQRDGSLALPPPCPSTLERWRGRIIHRLFNTHGRGMSHPSHVAVAAVLLASLG